MPDKIQEIHPIRGEIAEAVYGLGTVKSDQTYNLTATYPAFIEKVFVKEGMSIQYGQPLVKLLYGSPLLAPFSGIISSLNAHTGEIASTKGPILTLVNLKRRYVLVSLEQRDALRVHENQAASLSFEEDSPQLYRGTVASFYPSGEEFLARITVGDLPERVLPGMTMNVVIEISHKQDALLVPIEAIEKNRIVVMRNKRKINIPVTTGISDQEMVEILSGNLEPSDSILIEGK